jgi:GNAT superfamily N-acetyltransferase
MTIEIVKIDPSLAELCEAQYHQIGWSKPDGYFRECYALQQSEDIVFYVAHEGSQYVGHTKLVWCAHYPLFRDEGMPEIQDLNVLPGYRKQGIGTALIKCCEALAADRSDTIGIGVGLHPGYNNAQRLYSKLGYILDGRGVHCGNEPVIMGETYRFDDKLVICFTKQIGDKKGSS